MRYPVRIALHQAPGSKLKFKILARRLSTSFASGSLDEHQLYPLSAKLAGGWIARADTAAHSLARTPTIINNTRSMIGVNLIVLRAPKTGGTVKVGFRASNCGPGQVVPGTAGLL